MNKENLEIWKPIIGYEGLYEVSNLGRVKSFKNNRWGIGGEKILRLRLNIDGYLTVNLYKQGKPKTYTVHRLVALAFILNTENKLQVDHVNKIRDDNRVENLQWVTNSENTKKGYDQGRVISDFHKQRAKETHQIISTWYNTELNITFTGNSYDLVRAFPEMNLNSGHLRSVRNKKVDHHKNWICLLNVNRLI